MHGWGTNTFQELDTKKDELQSVKSELDAKTAELNECRGVEIEMRNKLEQIEKTSHDSRKRLAHWEEELGKLELKSTRYAPHPSFDIADVLQRPGRRARRSGPAYLLKRRVVGYG
jgi:hypothetical protein